MPPPTHVVSGSASGDTTDAAAVYIVAGPDLFLRSAAVRELIRRRAEEGGLGVSEHDGAEVDLATVLDDVRTPTLLAGRRVVVVRDADEFVSVHRAALEAYVAAPSACGVLVLECRQCASNTRLYKAVAQLKGIIACDPPRRSELPRWVASRAGQHYGCQMDEQAGQVLVELVGDDLGRLDAELDKLATYVGTRRVILPADVEAAVGDNRLELVFAVSDAIARRDVRGAMEHWERVLATDRAAPYMAVAGLAAALRRLVEARRALARGASAAELFPGRRPGGYQAAMLDRLRRLSVAQCDAMLMKLQRVDREAKSGGGDSVLGVEKFIIETASR